MRWLIDFSVRRPVAIAMLYCALGLLAWAAWQDLPVDVVPEGEVPKLSINTTWAGASAESVQSLITSPIEAVAVTVPGVHKVTSQSRRGQSAVEHAERTRTNVRADLLDHRDERDRRLHASRRVTRVDARDHDGQTGRTRRRIRDEPRHVQ